jgi:hypothetical protein
VGDCLIPRPLRRALGRRSLAKALEATADLTKAFEVSTTGSLSVAFADNPATRLFDSVGQPARMDALASRPDQTVELKSPGSTNSAADDALGAVQRQVDPLSASLLRIWYDELRALLVKSDSPAARRTPCLVIP